MGEYFGQDLVEVVVGIDNHQQIAQGLRHAPPTFNLVQALLCLSTQPRVFERERCVLVRAATCTSYRTPNHGSPL